MSKNCPANTGTDPLDVIAPQRSWRLTAVLYGDAEWSMALGEWRNDDDGNWRPVLAQRWNGWQGSKGNPVSTGHSTLVRTARRYLPALPGQSLHPNPSAPARV